MLKSNLNDAASGSRLGKPRHSLHSFGQFLSAATSASSPRKSMRFHLFHMIAAATLLTSVGALSTATVSESSNIAKLPSGSEQLHGVNKGRFLRVKEVVDDEKQGDDDDGDEEKMFKAEVAFAAQLMSKMRIEKEIDTAVASFFSLKFTPSKLFAHYDLKHVPRGDIKWSIYSKFKVDFKKKYPHRIA